MHWYMADLHQAFRCWAGGRAFLHRFKDCGEGRSVENTPVSYNSALLRASFANLPILSNRSISDHMSHAHVNWLVNSPPTLSLGVIAKWCQERHVTLGSPSSDPIRHGTSVPPYPGPAGYLPVSWPTPLPGSILFPCGPHGPVSLSTKGY